MLLIKTFVLGTPWCSTWASLTVIQWNTVGKTMRSFKMISYWMFTVNSSLSFSYFFNNFKVSISYCFLSIHFHSLFSIVYFRIFRNLPCLLAVIIPSKVKAISIAVKVTKLTFSSTTVLSISFYSLPRWRLIYLLIFCSLFMHSMPKWSPFSCNIIL